MRKHQRGRLRQKGVVSGRGEPMALGRRRQREALGAGLGLGAGKTGRGRWRGAVALLGCYHASEPLGDRGEAVGGSREGVSSLLRQYADELGTAMLYTGCATLAEIAPSILHGSK